MTFTWDFNTATLLAIATQIAMTIVFLVRTANTAKTAHAVARDAKKIGQDAHEKIALLQGMLHLHRETVAREFPDKESLREMEARLSKSIGRLSERIDELLRERKSH